MVEKEFVASVTIEYKPVLNDPEGTVISKDLLRAHGFEQVQGVRTAKLLRVRLKAPSKEKAEELVAKMCKDLRLANPISQNFSISIS